MGRRFLTFVRAPRHGGRPETVLFLAIIYGIDCTGDPANHRKQNSSAHRLIYGRSDEKTGYPCDSHNNDGYYSPELFHISFTSDNFWPGTVNYSIQEEYSNRCSAVTLSETRWFRQSQPAGVLPERIKSVGAERGLPAYEKPTVLLGVTFCIIRDMLFLVFLFPPDGNTCAGACNHNKNDDPPPCTAALRGLLRRLGGGFRRGDRGRGGTRLWGLAGYRFRLGVAAGCAGTLLLAVLACRCFLRDRPIPESVFSFLRGDPTAVGVFLLMRRLGGDPLRLAARDMVPCVQTAVLLTAELTRRRPTACRRAAGMSRGGDHLAGGDLRVAVLAVCVTGVALLGAGGGFGVLYLGAAVVVLRIKLAPW